MSKHFIIHSDSTRRLFMEIRHAEKSHPNDLFSQNLRLVVTIANRFYRSDNIELEDLIQEGNIALWLAVNKFDPSMGVKFSTYAGTAIRTAILKYMENKGHTIKGSQPGSCDSLDEQISDGKGKTFSRMEQLEKEHINDVKSFINNADPKRLDLFLNRHLTREQACIIEDFYGCCGHCKITQYEISKRYRISLKKVGTYLDEIVRGVLRTYANELEF